MENLALALPLEILKSDEGLGWTEVSAGAESKRRGPRPLLSIDEKGLTLYARQKQEMTFTWDELAWFDYEDEKAGVNGLS